MTSSSLYQSIDEKALFALIAQGDEPAFEKLFHVYVPKIQPVIVKLVKSDAVAKDIIQDVFLSLWVSREKLSSIESPNNWIFKMVYNRSYTWLEQQAVRAKADTLINAARNPGTVNPTEERIFFTETARLVSQAIHLLPPQTRKIYLMSRQEGLKNADIAEQLGLSVFTIKNTLVNAGKSIKTYLTEHGIELPLILFVYWLS